MGTTDRWAIPYPEPADPNDVPTHMQALAAKVDGLLGLAVVSAVAPAAPADNQLWYDTTAELMKRWDAGANAGAGAWLAEGSAAYARSAAGTYSGDGVTGDRTIALPFAPKLVVIANGYPLYAMSPVGAAGQGLMHYSTSVQIATSTALRPALAASGFVVSGTVAGELNTNGYSYSYLAIG